MHLRFGKRDRLISKHDYQRVFSGARRYADENFTLLSRENAVGYPRLGLAIAKKNIKTAVARNRIKRIARESFRLHAPDLPAVDVIVLARRGADRKSRQQLHAALAQYWSWLGKP